MDKLDLQTPNFTDENIQKLSELFPNCVTEDSDGKTINFDLLKQELSNHIVEGNKERYELSWPGKAESLVVANAPINKTLRPNREQSKNFDDTENLYIEGDNLEVLKLLQETYLGKVKMIYIDPPYNTGNDFVYRDNFTQDKAEYDEESGNIDDEGGRLVSNPDSNGRYHSDWLSMMYPRLKLATNLLKEDGSIFVSINEHEVSSLKLILDQVFGENNFIGMVTISKGTTTGQDAKKIGSSVDYLLVYAKNILSFELTGLPLSVKDKERFKEQDDKGYFSKLQFRKTGTNDRRGDRPNLFYELIAPDNSKILPYGPGGYESRWRTSHKTFLEWEKENLIVWQKKEGKYIPYVKYYLEGRTKQVSNLWNDLEGNKKASLTVKELFKDKVFDFPKPISLLKRCIKISSVSQDEIILDFFSGSSTTAHAIIEINAEECINRKFIMIQIPEATNEESEAYKAGFKTITEIGKERIRLAGKKIKEENAEKENIDKLDVGFRVLKVDSSNMKDIYFTPDETNQSNILDLASNIKEDRNSEDLLFMVLLNWGIDLSAKIEKKEIEGKEVYFVDDNYLAACFDENIDEHFVKTLIDHKPLKVVLKDSSFASSSVKINVEQIFVQANIEAKVI